MRTRATHRKITPNTHRVIMETLLEIIARREKQLRGKLTVLDQQQQAIITEQQICQTRALAVSTRLKELMGWQGTLSCHLLLDKKQQMAGLFTQAQSFLTQRQQLENQYQQLVSRRSELQKNFNALMKKKEKNYYGIKRCVLPKLREVLGCHASLIRMITRRRRNVWTLNNSCIRHYPLVRIILLQH